MPKNRKSSAHNYKMQAKNEVLINYRQEHISEAARNGSLRSRRTDIPQGRRTVQA